MTAYYDELELEKEYEKYKVKNKKPKKVKKPKVKNHFSCFGIISEKRVAVRENFIALIAVSAAPCSAPHKKNVQFAPCHAPHKTIVTMICHGTIVNHKAKN